MARTFTAFYVASVRGYEINRIRPLQNAFVVAQTSQSAVSRISKSADFRVFPALAELEFGDTAGLETCATGFSRGLGIALTGHVWFEVPDRRGFVNITGTVEGLVRKSGVNEGICLVNAMHLTPSANSILANRINSIIPGSPTKQTLPQPRIVQ